MNLDKFPEIVLGIIKRGDEEILVIQRAKEEKGTDNVKLSWAFPGGKVEDGETKEQAIEREIFEETGNGVDVKSIISERRHPQFPVYVYYFECELKSTDTGVKPQDKEVKDIKWVRASDLKNYFTTDLDPKVALYLGLI